MPSGRPVSANVLSSRIVIPGYHFGFEGINPILVSIPDPFYRKLKSQSSFGTVVNWLLRLRRTDSRIDGTQVAMAKERWPGSDGQADGICKIEGAQS